MSDPVKNFEFILKKHYNSRPSTLYSDNKSLNKHTYNPRDVISSVSSQLKAIYSADRMESNKRISKDLNKFKKSSFLSVNNLTGTDDQPSKHTAKFDTQCVSDTQLIGIIENAEIQDVHIGVTQEFETAFIHTNTEKQDEHNQSCDLSVNIEDNILETDDSEDMVNDSKTIKEINVHFVNKDNTERDNVDNKVNNIKNKIVITDIKNSNLHNDNSAVSHRRVSKETEICEVNNSNPADKSQTEQFSQILQTITVKDRFENDKDASYENDSNNSTHNSMIADDSELLNQCIEIEDNENTERPPSPIFINKHVKIKSKSPSPLVFNLDKFEHFESIAISLLDTHDFNTARHLINSQILDKELHLKINEKIEFPKRCSSDIVEEEDIIKNLGSPIIDKDIEVIEIDKATSEEILNQLKNDYKDNAGIKSETSFTTFKDEILFSSDEEENYIHKEYQDLPFTCALETSFYNQSDVLDKNMYVGFQTASNRSIQVCADSFVRAKSILSGIDEDVTVTDLVKSCESAVRNKFTEGQTKRGLNEESVEFDLTNEKPKDSVLNDLAVDIFNKSPEVSNKELSKVNDLKIPNDKNNLLGFMTANNKAINLSKKALARCKKVFQDIDLNENFKCVKDNLQGRDIHCEEKLKESIPSCDNIKVQNIDNLILIDDVLENIDEEIIQEFENIEMSLKDDNQEETKFKITNTDIQISENDFKDFDQDFHENAPTQTRNIQETLLSQVIGNPITAISKTNVGFKTASNNNINISKEAWVKSINVFKNLDAIEFPKKPEQKLDEIKNNEPDIIQPGTSIHEFVNKTATYKDIKDSNHDKDIGSVDELPKEMNNDIPKDAKSNISQPSTSKGFVGFKTANNKNIKISKEAWSNSKALFNDIDSIELPKKGNKTYPRDSIHETKTMNEKIDFYKFDDTFVGFRTANNKNINISVEALAKTKSIFNDIDSPDLIVPVKINKDPERLDVNASKSLKQMEVASKVFASVEFTGFKSASNKVIKLSEKALAEAQNIFKEIDSIDLEIAKRETKVAGVLDEMGSKTGFIGFKTANNKNIQISDEALAKTKNIFNDIDHTDFKRSDKNKTNYPGFEADYITTESSINKDGSSKNVQEIEALELQGFKTASNKKIKISSEAMIQTRGIFKDININNDSDMRGQTDKQKDLYPKELINHDNSEANPTSPVFKGFQTANKTPVVVSAKAVEKSKKLFEDLDVQITNKMSEFSGFQTASNKQVKISEKALANSRKIFKGIVFDDNISSPSKQVAEKGLYPEEILQEKEIDVGDANDFANKEVTDIVPTFEGFQTASKKPVAVSKLALEKSKKLFQDLDENTIVEKDWLETKKIFDRETTKSHSFKGFQTASDKKVIISKEALAKTKKIFHNIDDNIENRIQGDIKKSNFKIGFQTGNDKAITVSDEALARSKRLFSEIDDVSLNTSKKEKKTLENEEIHAIIDTQVLNNFEESLYTEDFRKSPKNSKRAGSPILSCPRAKKRKKFETPYNTKSISKPMPLTTETAKVEKEKITFSEEYKTYKKYTLKDLNNITKNKTSNIDPYLLNFDYDNLLQFEFNGNRNDLSYGNMTIDVLKELFLNSINAKLVPNGWLDNHLKLILWKLISYEVKFKSAVVCTARNVTDQLKYRYDRELYNSERPALRKILEKDDVASKTVVLCVIGIYADGVRVSRTSSTSLRSSITDTTSNIELLLTDGWYCIRCSIDKMLVQLVCSGSIPVGSKIVTTGAELTGCEQGVAPWEDTSAVRLKIYGNSTRRARWDTRLGYHGHSAILCQLSSVKVLGGKVSKLRVLVTRVYPALYVEKFEDGSTVTRSERLENLHQMKTEAERQSFMEKLYEEVEKEFADQESQDSEGLSDSCKRTCIDSGSQIAKMMKRSKDPGEFRAQLTESQLNLLESHTLKSRDRLLQDIQTRVRDKMEKAGVCVSRNVVSLLKIRVAGVTERGDDVIVTKGMMSIWKPNDAIQEIIKEGAWIDVLNVVPTAVRYSEIQISAGRQSIFSTSRHKEPENMKPYTKLLQRQCYTVKNLSQTPYMITDYNEIDTVGLIFSIEPSIKEFDSTKQSFQNIYLTDADKNIICINFWGGLKKFGFQNVLDTGQVIACVNLQKRAGNTRKSIPQFRVTEFSYFTQSPKNEIARRMLSDIHKQFSALDKRKFCLECVVLKNNYSVTKNNENISPYRFMNTDVNMSKNKVFIDSPLARQNKLDDNFNLTGLDFESTFKQDTQLSEEMLQRKKKVNEKIARLKMYGEPPPLSPMHIINRSKQACSSYKSPLLSNNNINSKSFSKNLINPLHSKCDSSKNVASLNNTPQKCGESEINITNSPVLLNRTYVKSVNPVKINFDVQYNDSNVDHFGDEFDGSPPLSLD